MIIDHVNAPFMIEGGKEQPSVKVNVLGLYICIKNIAEE